MSPFCAHPGRLGSLAIFAIRILDAMSHLALMRLRFRAQFILDFSLWQSEFWNLRCVLGRRREATAVIDPGCGDGGLLGAKQNRLQVTINNINTQHANVSASNSRIRDVDVAEETADLTKNNILMQAGVSVLAQANQIPQLALNLLNG